MRRRIFVLAALAAPLGSLLLTPALATAGAGGAAVAAAWSHATPIERAQYYSFDGVDYCWYDEAWQGPGWYWCGYDWTNGYGWGGPYGWNGWGGGGYWWRRHHDHDHDHNHDHNHGVYHEGPSHHEMHGGPNDHERREGPPGGQSHGVGPLPHGGPSRLS